MQGARVVISLSPSRLEGALLRARKPVKSAAVELDPTEWAAAWTDRLRPLDAELRTLVKDLGASGLSAEVYHRGPDAIASIFSCPAAGRAAREAASLALSDQVPFDIGLNPSDVQVAIREPGGRRRVARTHLLVAADRDATAAVVAEWAERGELKVARIAPIDAAHLLWLVQEVCAWKEERVRVLLRIGEHRSMLGAGKCGRLLVIRHVDFGVEQLVDALTRPVQPSGLVRQWNGLPQEEVRLSHAHARQLLASAGIPLPTQSVDEALGLRGSDVLPLVQALLQRCVVETKQAVRFGLEEEDRERAELAIAGPGARVQRLAEVLAGQMNLPLMPLDTRAEGGEGVSEDVIVAVEYGPRLNLLPRDLERSFELRRVRRALWVGAGIAAGVAAVQSAIAWTGATAIEKKAMEMRPGAQAAEEALQRREELLAKQTATAALRQAVESCAGEHPQWAAALRELGNVTPEWVRLTEVVADADGSAASRPTLELRGYAMAEAEGRTPELQAYLAALRASPLVAELTLGMTQRTRMDRGEALQFSVMVYLVNVPRHHADFNTDSIAGVVTTDGVEEGRAP